MKKLQTIFFTAVMVYAFALSSCSGHKTTGRIYMPDMSYSRAYETYALRDSDYFTIDANHKGGKQIFYNAIPAAGTIKRGELYPYTLPNDSNGYKQSAMVLNPLDSNISMKEAGRLFNINCAICHGEKGTANGPIASGGFIGGVANLTLPLYAAMADGTMFHSITYGKNLMGSYASQLDRKQRWMMVKYIRSLQKPASAASTVKDSTATKTTVKDSAATVKK